LTKKAPYKGLSADSEEKHEPVSDIDSVAVDSLKALDPSGRLEKRTCLRRAQNVADDPKRRFAHRQLAHCERFISPWVLAASHERHLANGKMEYSSAGEPTSLRSDAVSVQSKVIA